MCAHVVGGFEGFKNFFGLWADRYLEEWSKEYNVTKPLIYILPEEQLDPWEAGLVYVLSNFRHSGIRGPAIIVPERYLMDLYFSAVIRGHVPEMWNDHYWSLAHEFGHHLKFFNPQLRVPFFNKIQTTLGRPFGLMREAKRRAEIGASVRAGRMTGKTRVRHVQDFVSVTGMHPLRYVAETSRKVREVVRGPEA